MSHHSKPPITPPMQKREAPTQEVSFPPHINPINNTAISQIPIRSRRADEKPADSSPLFEHVPSGQLLDAPQLPASPLTQKPRCPNC